MSPSGARDARSDESQDGEASRQHAWALVVFGALCISLVVGLLASGQLAHAASDGYSYFPTASATDGKMLAIAGPNLSTLSGTTITVSFSVPASETTFTFGFFDGAVRTPWEFGANPGLETSYTVYADPSGVGTGTVVVAELRSQDMLSNAWSDFTLDNTAAALAPSGRYFYKIVATVQGGFAGVNDINAFKFRVKGSTYITPLGTFGYIGAYNQAVIYPSWPATTPTTYDGNWDFYVRIPQGNTRFDVWDGDFDLSGVNGSPADTDDPNTPSTIPTWSTTAALAEAARQGAPADDNTPGNAYLRTPNIRYTVYDPLGNSYFNENPSGGTEWEVFRIDSTTTDTAVTDYYATDIPAGLWRVSMTGVDLHNLNALRFEHPIIGVDASGTPVEPEFPYAIGDRVWLDANRNGLQDSGETSIGAAILTLRDAAGSFITSTTADSNGLYRLTTLPGTYTVDVNDPANYVSGGPLAGLVATTARIQSVVITSTNDFTLDFGFAKGPALVVVKDRAASSPATAAVGDVTTYTVSVSNVGSATANSIVVTDTLVGSVMEYVPGSTSASWPGGSSTSDPTSPTADTLRWDFGAGSQIPAGSALTLTYEVRVRAGVTAWGSYVDTASVGARDASGTAVAPDGSTWIPEDTNPDDTDTANVWVTVPGVSVTKTRSSADATIQAGQTADFDIVVRNTGDSRIETLSVGDVFPSANLSYLTATPLLPSVVGSGALTWANVGPLDSGQQTTITVTFAAGSSPPGYSAVDTATAGPTIDVNGRPVPSSTSTASVAITRPSLSVSKVLSSPDATIQAGQAATFTIVVRNDGNTRIDSIPLSDAYDIRYLTYTTATPAPVADISTLTTYAVVASDTAGTWSNDANSLGPAAGDFATSGNPPFEMWHSFAFPPGMSAVTSATVRVRSRAHSGWGASFAAPRTGFSLPNSTIQNGNWNIAGSTPALTRHESVDDTPTVDDGVTYLTGTGNNEVRLGLSNPALPANATNIQVGVTIRVADNNTGNNNVFYRLRVNGTNYDGTSRNPTGTWTTYTETYTVNPDTGAAWTPADVNGTGGNPIEWLALDSSDQTPQPWVTFAGLWITYDLPVTNDDTWAIDYSTDAGVSWSSIAAPSAASEGAQTDHVAALSGILTPANSVDFRVRVRGAVVGSADASGVVDWDRSQLDVVYETARPNDGVLDWSDVGPLDPGEQTTLTVSFVASATPGGDHSTVDTATVGTTADVFGDPPDITPGTASVAITRPGIHVNKQLSASQPATVGVGGTVRFDVVVSNTGDTTITAPSIVDTWAPAYLEYVSASPSAAATESGVATWTTLPPIAPGAATTITVEFTALAVPPGGTTVNRVTATGTDVYGDPLGTSSSDEPIGVVDTRVTVTKTRTSAEATISVGSNVVYTIVARNTGTSVLTTVPVNDAYEEAYLDYSSAIPPPSATTSGSLSWDNVGPLNPGQQTTITVTFAAQAAPPGKVTTDTASIAGARDASGTAAATVTASASVAVLRTSLAVTKISLDADGFLPVGASGLFSIRVTNSGDTTITTVHVADAWTTGLAFSSSQPATTPVGNGATFTVGPLVPGASQDITVTLSGLASGPATNAVTVTGTDELGSPVPTETAAATVTVTNPAVTVTKTASTSTVLPGQDVTYTVTVLNSGDTTLLAGTAVDRWDSARLSFVSSTPATAPVGDVATFPVGPLAPGVSQSITMVLRATTTTGVASNDVTVTAVDVHGDPIGPRSATATVTVRRPVLSVSKVRTSGATITAGEDVSWRIDVTNSGDATAAPLTLVDTWTASLLDYVSASHTPDATSSGIATFTVPVLASGESTSIAVTLRATGATGTAQNAASASTPGGVTPPSFVATVHVGAPDLVVIKTRSTDATAMVGETVSWSIIVTNNGDATATPVAVVDTWTAGLEFASAAPSPDATSSTTATFTIPSLRAGETTTIAMSTSVTYATRPRRR